MSKRFGRNRRRKMRQELAQAREREWQSAMAYENANTVLKYVRQRFRECGIGPYTALLPPEKRAGKPWANIAYHPAMRLNCSAPASDTYFLEALHALRVEVERDPRFFAILVHMVVNDQGRLSYQISQSALMRFGTDEIERFLIPEIARQMSELLGRNLLRGQP